MALIHWMVRILTVVWLFLVTEASDEQRRLIAHLFENPRYDKRVRPTGIYKQPINVTIRFNLYQIVNVDERNQYMSVYAWVTQMWDDITLKWDPWDYKNLSSIVVPHKEIWRPDTYLYNQIQMATPASERQIGAILSVDPNERPPRYASVVFRYPAIYRFTCNIDVQYFPFDVQHCRMVFSSWQYDSMGIDFFPEKEDTWREDFIDTGEWTVISSKSYRCLEYYSCCANPYSMLYIDLVIRRRPLHYIVNLVAPTLVISAIANLGFFAPSSTTGERMAKINLGMSTLFALTVILLMIAEEMPKSSSSVPLISGFFLGIVLQTSSATVATGVILFLHNRGLQGHKVPPLVRRLFFDILAPKLFVPQRLERKVPPPSFELISPESSLANNVLKTAYLPLELSKEAGKRSKSPILEPMKKLQWHIEKLRILVLQKYSGKIFYVYPESETAREWDWLASILDRMCLIGSMLCVCLLGGVFLGVGIYNLWYHG